MPLRYLLAFRSNMVYLSLACISASVGISVFHSSNDFSVSPFFANATLNVSTTLSTARSRCRCRYFWGADMRQGIFLHRESVQRFLEAKSNTITHHRRPPLKGFVILNGPNMVVVVGAATGPPSGLEDVGGPVLDCPKKRGSVAAPSPVTASPIC